MSYDGFQGIATELIKTSSSWDLLSAMQQRIMRGVPETRMGYYTEMGLKYETRYLIEQDGLDFAEEWDCVTAELRKFPEAVKWICIVCRDK